MTEAAETSAERVVWKYLLEQPLQQLALRRGAVFRHMDVVSGQPVLWIEQPADPPSEPEEVWTVRIVGTGHRFIPVTGQEHLGSARCNETGLVWHLYRLHVQGGAS